MRIARVLTVLPIALGACLLTWTLVEAVIERPAREAAAPGNASEAAAAGSAWRALKLVRSGSSFNTRGIVRAGFLDGNDHQLYPLEAAILGRHEELVRFLQANGASMPGASRRDCLTRYRLPELLGPQTPASPSSVADALSACAATVH